MLAAKLTLVSLKAPLKQWLGLGVVPPKELNLRKYPNYSQRLGMLGTGYALGKQEGLLRYDRRLVRLALRV